LSLSAALFALQRKKEYGNKDQDEYVDWLLQFAEPIKQVLRDTGSNTTGAVAESSSRRWIAFEKQQDYLVASAFRFLDNISESQIKAIYEQLRGKEASNMRLPQRMQAELPL
jgi:hypothetical protein